MSIAGDIAPTKSSNINNHQPAPVNATSLPTHKAMQRDVAPNGDAEQEEYCKII